ncbi:MAG: type II toxin-antitoxin system VapC family toxin [Proteobacteria bacterium]|nr:type II toxin-antitoxin system VapC family toxin [Pseudomonadota bacterium]
MILDTCALLWLASGDRKLSRATLKKIDAAAAVHVSAISGFEIALKVARGQLTLPLAPQEWFDQVLTHHGLTVLPLALNVCITAAQLPPIHNDPCDRFIIATARLHDLTVVTADEQFAKYGLKVIC